MTNHYSAGIVAYRYENDQREYLILQYAAGHWDFPKGHMEGNETKEEAAHRELFEEAGLKADIDPGFESSFSYFFMQNGSQHFKEVYFFKGQVHPGTVVLSHEHQGYRWLPYQQALELLTYENAKQLLREAHEADQE